MPVRFDAHRVIGVDRVYDCRSFRQLEGQLVFSTPQGIAPTDFEMLAGLEHIHDTNNGIVLFGGPFWGYTLC